MEMHLISANFATFAGSQMMVTLQAKQHVQAVDFMFGCSCSQFFFFFFRSRLLSCFRQTYHEHVYVGGHLLCCWYFIREMVNFHRLVFQIWYGYAF